jgi:hypothetical protein
VEAKRAAPEPAEPPGDEAPSPELALRFAELEQRVDDAVERIGELKKEKSALEARLAQEAQLRAEAARRIAALLDKIDTLL